MIKTYETFSKEQLQKIMDNGMTYVYKFSNYVEKNEEIESVLKLIRNYDVNKLLIEHLSYGIYIKPDNELKEILYKLNDLLLTENKIDIENLSFDFTLTNLTDKNGIIHKVNSIDFEKGIPEILRGTGFGYKLYKIIINLIGFVTSDSDATPLSINVWYNLLQDKHLYCYTSKIDSGVLLKNLTNAELKDFLDKIKQKEVIFDSELETKIIQLYGSLENYKKPT